MALLQVWSRKKNYARAQQVYHVKDSEHGKYVILFKDTDGKEVNLVLGDLTKDNNRGLTFETFIFSGREVEVFLSRSDFKIEKL